MPLLQSQAREVVIAVLVYARRVQRHLYISTITLMLTHSDTMDELTGCYYQ